MAYALIIALVLFLLLLFITVWYKNSILGVELTKYFYYLLFSEQGHIMWVNDKFSKLYVLIIV